MLEGGFPSIISGVYMVYIGGFWNSETNKEAGQRTWEDVRSAKKKIVSKKMTLIITITQTENVQGWLVVRWRVYISPFGPGL